MKGYDINKIKTETTKDPSVEKLLTGKYITGLENRSEVSPNAELEGGEYIQFPDGTTQLVAGESHEKGGVKMFIPDGTKMVSKSLKPTKKQIKKYKEEYNLKITSNDTYASVITKFNRMIGLEKNYLEQEEVIKILKKEQDKTDVPDATNNVNMEYLSGKLNDLEKEAQQLEAKKSEFFLVVFEDQEASKSESKKKKALDGEMKYGGVSKQQFRDLCKKHGVSYKQGLNLIGHKTPSFDKGGEFDELKKKYDTEEKIETALLEGLITDEQYNELVNWLVLGENDQFGSGRDVFTTKSGEHTYSNTDIYTREKQSRSDSAFGKVGESDIESVMWHYYQNFPKAAKKHLGVKIGDDGKITWDKSIDFSVENEKTRAFQEAANKVMVASDKSILSEDAKKYFSEDFRRIAQDHLDNQTFVSEVGKVRSFDGKLGNFTSGRYINTVNVVTPEELEKLNSMHLYTLSQVEEALKENPDLISPESQEQIKKLGTISTDDSDYRLDSYETPPAVEDEVEDKEEVKGYPIEELDITPPQQYYPRLFATPNQYPLPPSPMQSHLMGETRFQRMDPIRIGIEPQIQEAGEQRRFLADQLFGNLSPNVAASVMANQMAAQTKAINQEARAANMVNANNLASTELFNIGQHAKEQEANLRNQLSFEQRQYTAQAKTEENLRRFYDQVRRIHVNDFKTQQNLNLLNQMFPDYNLATNSMVVDYEPSYDWDLKEDPFYELFKTSPYVS